MTATASDTMPGTVRIWQPARRTPWPRGREEGTQENRPEEERGQGHVTNKVPPKKKSELEADEEMQLTVVQFGGKMIANDFRKRRSSSTTSATCTCRRRPTPGRLCGRRNPDGGRLPGSPRHARRVLDEQKEKDAKTGKESTEGYQEMIAIGSVHVRKQGEFFGDADKVTYSELKGTLTFHGSKKNPAVVNKLKDRASRRTLEAETIIYYVKSKTFESINATRLSQ